MLYDEKQMLEICKKYGIETVEKEGYPLYQGKEMDGNFSYSEMMHRHIPVTDSICDKISYYMKCIKRKLQSRRKRYRRYK